MRPIALVPLALAGLLVTATPIPSSAYSYAYGHDEDFGWAIVSDGRTQTSDLRDSDVLDELRDRYDGDFLYVRDGKDQYLIRDARQIQRARRTTDEIGKYGKEIGELARAQAKLALSRFTHGGQRRSLEKARRELEREIARNERHGEPTEGLERALKHIKDEIEALPDEDRDAGLSATDRADLERQSDRARKKLQDAIDKMRREIRDILRESKERGQAEKLDTKGWKSY